MPKACDNMKSTGRNVLMAVQRLQAEPHSDVAKENMVTAARRLLQATVKVGQMLSRELGNSFDKK